MIEKNAAGLYETVIDDKTYEFTMWGAEESMDTLIDIAALVGKPLSHVGAKAFTGEHSGLAGDISAAALEAVLSGLVDQITTHREMVMRVIKRLAAHKVFCDGKQVAFDTHYRNAFGHLVRVCRTALEVQYGNFFDAATDLGVLRPAVGKATGAKQVA